MATLEFETYGPYQVTFDEESKRFSANEELLTDDAGDRNVLDCKGCYVYGTMWGEQFTPWYAGKTTRSFRNEIFQTHKQDKLLSVRVKTCNRSLFVLLIIAEQRRGRQNKKAVGQVEQFLIQICSRANDEIGNIRGIPKRTWAIRGVTDVKPGRPNSPTRLLRQIVEA